MENLINNIIILKFNNKYLFIYIKKEIIKKEIKRFEKLLRDFIFDAKIQSIVRMLDRTMI